MTAPTNIEEISNIIHGDEPKQDDDDGYTPDTDNAVDIDELRGGADDGMQEVEEQEADETGQTQEVSAEGDAGGIESLTDLASELEIDPSELYELKVPMPGGIKAKSIGEIKDEYTDFVRTKQQLESKAAELDRIKEQGIQPQVQGQIPLELQQQLEATQRDVVAIEQSYNSIDWAKFEDENPGAAALQKQKFQEAFQTAQGKQAQLVQQAETAKQQSVQQTVAAEQQKLMQMLPEWNDRDTAVKEVHELQSVLQEYGFSLPEISNIVDSRQIKLAVDMMRLKRELQNASPEKVARETSKSRKTLKAGGGLKLRNKSKDRKKAELYAKAKASRDPRDKIGAISQLLNGG